jgi:hypothetical protein
MTPNRRGTLLICSVLRRIAEGEDSLASLVGGVTMPIVGVITS